MEERSPTRIIRLKELTATVSLSSAWIYELMSRGLFPRNHKLYPGSRASGWFSDEIDDWINNKGEYLNSKGEYIASDFHL